MAECNTKTMKKQLDLEEEANQTTTTVVRTSIAQYLRNINENANRVEDLMTAIRLYDERNTFAHAGCFKSRQIDLMLIRKLQFAATSLESDDNFSDPEKSAITFTIDRYRARKFIMQNGEWTLKNSPPADASVEPEKIDPPTFIGDGGSLSLMAENPVGTAFPSFQLAGKIKLSGIIQVRGARARLELTGDVGGHAWTQPQQQQQQQQQQQLQQVQANTFKVGGRIMNITGQIRGSDETRSTLTEELGRLG